jgi:uncharacterized repeat protein (TIGR01451 family)
VYGCQSDAASTYISNAMTDLSLALAVSRRTLAPGDTVTFTLTVTNEGGCDAGAVTMQNRLPSNMTFVSSADLTASNGVVTGNLTNVAPGQSVSRRFVARLTAEGTYSNAAQLIAQSRLDPDSQPNSGTGDGQDDAAMVDLRTKSVGTLALFSSPNPYQTPLPALKSNQPAPDSNKADLSLAIELGQRNGKPGQTVTITLKVANQGGLAATGIRVLHNLPTGLQVVATSLPANMTANGSTVTGSISQLAAGQTASLTFTATVTGQGNLINTAQIMAADQPDPDSTPGNGTTNGEDDTAQAGFRSAGAAGARMAATPAATVSPKQVTDLPKVNGQIQHRFSGNGQQ